jgi:hypothetical protein
MIAPMSVHALVVSLLSLLLLIVPSLAAAHPNGTKCPPAKGRPETCVCQPTNQDLVDLTPLANTNGTARYIIIELLIKIIFTFICIHDCYLT